MAENRTTEQTPAIPDFIQRHIDNAESLFPGEPQAEIPLPPGSISAVPSTMEQVKAGATGFAKGFAEDGTLLGSTVLGGMWGTRVAPLTGPAAPFMPLVGALGGFAYGLFASDLVGSFFPEAARDDVIGVYEAGRIFGGGLAFAPSAMFFKAAPQGANVINKTINAIGDYARANKGAYYTGEAVASFYAGLAGGVAAQEFPDSPGVRAGAEISASLFPSRFVPQLINSAKNAVVKGKAIATATGYSDKTINYVQKQLTDVIENAGEDPQQIVKAIDDFLKDQLGATSVPLATVAQTTGSPIFTALQSTIARGNAKYSGDTKEIGENTLKAYDSIVQRFQNSGDPGLLQAAAILRKDNLEKQFQTAFNIAQTNAVEKATKLGTRGSDNRLFVGDILQQEMGSLLRIARQSETQLWQNAVKGTFREADGAMVPIKIKPSNFAEALYEVTSSPFSSGSKSDVAGELSAFSKDLSGLGFNTKKLKELSKVPVTPEYLETRQLAPEVLESLNLKGKSAIDMVRLRSSLLDKAREAAGAGKTAAAGRYSKLASSLLDDLDALPEGQYAEARAFSRELNDAFTRTFAGDVSATTRAGADVLAPEVLVQRAFTGGADSTLKRMREMETAANFVDPSGEAAKSVRSAEKKVVQAFASEALNPDGSVNVNTLDSFRAKHADTLRYLGMEADFADVSAAQRTLLDVQDPGSLLTKRIDSEKAFANLLKVDDPATAVSMALTDKTAPVRNFKSLVESASSPTNPVDRKQARDGLMSTIFQYVYQTASKTGDFSPQAFNDVMFKPLSPNNPSLANMLRSSDLMSSEELGRLKQISNRMLNVETALKTQASIVDPDKVFTAQSAVEDLAVTWMGAKMASRYGPQGSGSLAFAGKTIGFFRNFFNKAPARQKLLLLEEATKDPMLFKELMSRNPTAPEARNTQLSFLRHLYSPAVFPTAVDRYVETLPDEPEASEEAPQPQAAAMLRSLPPAPVTRGTPNLQLPTPQGPAEQAQAAQAQAPAPAQGAPMESSSREMLQRLFPMDMS